MNEHKAPWYYLLLLILSGEAVFMLPFVLARVFRPTVLETYNIDNTELGLCYSAYGVVALFSYLLGGPIADRYAPRKLIAISLWLTALGGLYYASFPSFRKLQVLYGYWGFTTIFLFWAPMIKATRFWGGKKSQGKAFGFLDGGRGLVGALISSLGVLIFSMIIGDEVVGTNASEGKEAFRLVVLTTSAIIGIVGLMSWFFLRFDASQRLDRTLDSITLFEVKQVLRLPAVWLLALIILSAYVGYKATDILSLYAKEVMLYDQVDSAKVGTFLLFVRPIIGVIIGVIADRSKVTLFLFIGFIIMFLGSLLFASGAVQESMTILFILSVLTVSIGVYAIRSLYFAVMERGQIPLMLTGTAVGLISLVGYTPDIFAGPAMGYLLDNNPGIIGHQNVFWMLSSFSILGVVTSWIYLNKYGQKTVQ